MLPFGCCACATPTTGSEPSVAPSPAPTVMPRPLKKSRRFTSAVIVTLHWVYGRGCGALRGPSQGEKAVTCAPLAVKKRPYNVVSQFETMATQSPPIHGGGGAGGALGNPIGLSGPPPACRLPVRLSRRTTTGFPRPHPPRPP